MKRYLLSLAILVVGLFWIGVGAPVWGGESLLEPSEPKPKAVDLYDPISFPYDAERDAGVMKILGQNKTVSAMLAGRELGRDYWIQVSGDYPGRDGKGTAMVDIYFDPPVSYAGEVPARSDPCVGIVDPPDDDPCYSEPREYLTKYKTFSDVQVITAVTDLKRGAVVDILDFGYPPMKWQWDHLKERYAQ